ncbi:MAG: hypothetical protein ACXVB0_03805, partial [Mucilaginibacter sp.]
NERSLDFYSLFLAITAACLLWFVLPMTVKMILGIPAMVLTNKYLVDNLGGHSIEWSDVSEIRIIQGQYRSFSKLIINLKRPEKYFDTPLKKLLYKFRQFFTANDIGIITDFVSGTDLEIMQVVQAYWGKHTEP